MSIQVLFFGPLTEITGANQIRVESAGNLQELTDVLAAEYPELNKQAYKWAVNKTLVNNHDQPLKDGDEVALLPPFAGG